MIEKEVEELDPVKEQDSKNEDDEFRRIEREQEQKNTKNLVRLFGHRLLKLGQTFQSGE
jgi:hypothetical protein